MSDHTHPDDLVTLVSTPSEFEAQTLVAVLAEAGIEAFAFGVPALPALGMRLGGCPVQVRQSDLERARQALAQNVADSVDLDWDDADLGEREDNLPLTPTTRMPLFARIGFFFAMVILVSTIAGFAVSILLVVLHLIRDAGTL